MRRRDFLRRSVACSTAAALAARFGSPSARAEKSKPDRIRVGQIGTTHAHARGKMETFRKFPELFEVVGVVEPDAGRREQLSAQVEYREVPLTTEEQLLATPGLQAVAVETEVRDLVATGRRCIAAGVHIHLDKPGGEGLEDFRSLLDEATARQRIVQMGYMLRYNPAFQFAYRAVREGWLGEVFELHGVMSKQVDDATRRELAEYPGGTMFELGCHMIDSLVYILGKPEAVQAFTRRTRGGSDDLADNQLAVFEYKHATATIRSSVIEPHGGERRQFTVCGTEGVIDIHPIEPPRMRLALNKARDGFKAGYQSVELKPRAGRYDGDFIDLAAVIRGEKEFEFTPAHDLATQEAILLASGVLKSPNNTSPPR